MSMIITGPLTTLPMTLGQNGYIWMSVLTLLKTVLIWGVKRSPQVRECIVVRVTELVLTGYWISEHSDMKKKPLKYNNDFKCK